MSVLSKIRENVGLVIILIAVSLAAFILTDLFRGLQGGGNDRSVGTVAGEKVDYQLLQNKIAQFQRNVGGTTTSEEEYQLRQQAWESLINEVLYAQQIDDLGLKVTETEVSQMYLGPFVHRFIQQVPDFQGPNGQFSPDTVRKRLQLAEQINMNDPQIQQFYKNWKQFMIDLRETVIQDRLEQKYQGMLRGGIFVSTNEAKRSFVDQNKSVTFSYVSIPYSTISDQEVTVTDADYQAYYDKVKASFEQDLSVTIKYVSFPKTPSRSDSANVRSDISKVGPDWMDTDSIEMLQYVINNSDGDLDTNYRTLDLVSTEISRDAAMMAGKYGKDTLFGPIMDGKTGSYVIYRVGDSRPAAGEAEAIHARHILIPIAGQQASDTTEALAKARDIRNQANNGNFAELVKEHSKDFLTQSTAGDLGWITASHFGPQSEDMEKALKENPAGSIFVAETGRGVHVVEILGKDKNAYQVLAISRKITPGFMTTDSVNNLANQFAATASSVNSLDSAVSEYPGATVLTSPPINPGTMTLVGVSGARPVINWALEAEEGAMIDEVIQTDDAFVVAKVISRAEKGILPLEKAKDRIRFQVYNKKKAEAIKAKIGNVSDLNAAATAGGGTVKVASGVTFAFNPNQPPMDPIEQEHMVVGAAFSMQQGQVSQPIQGNSGVYVIRVDAVKEAGEMPEPQIVMQKQMIASSKRGSAVQKFFLGLRDLSDIEDRRFKMDF